VKVLDCLAGIALSTASIMFVVATGSRTAAGVVAIVWFAIGVWLMIASYRNEARAEQQCHSIDI
jgi:hypothetical protein